MTRKKVSSNFNFCHYFKTKITTLSIEEKQAEPEEKEAEDSKGHGDTKGEESSKDSGESYGDMFRNKVQGFFFDPQMDPRPENWIALVAMFGLIYYIINYREPRKEIV